jgi:hypothetical protein
MNRDCTKGIAGCKCAAGFKPEEQCPECREDGRRYSYCMCPPDFEHERPVNTASASVEDKLAAAKSSLLELSEYSGPLAVELRARKVMLIKSLEILMKHPESK